MYFNLKITNISKKNKLTNYYDNVSFEINDLDKIVFLIGENGAGKTSIIRSIFSLYNNFKGSVNITVNDKIYNSKNSLFRSFLSYLPESDVMSKEMTVYKNLWFLFSLYCNDKKLFDDKLNELRKWFDIDNIMNRSLRTLSSGQRKLVSIIGALIQPNALIYIFDEPTENLSVSLRLKFYQYLKTKKLTCLVTTHNYFEVIKYYDRIIHVSNGKILSENAKLKDIEYMKEFGAI